MPYDSTTPERTSSPLGHRRPTLASSFVPTPDHPEAMRRTLAFSTLSIFLLLFIWEACTAAPMHDAFGSRIGRWMTRQSVGWSEGSGGQWAVGPPGWDAPSGEVETGEDSGSREDETADNVTTLDWNRYVWHRDLPWNEGSGRLILVGDVHGMVDALKNLLRRISPAPGDKVVLIGDLVAKHPSIRSSLETVQYAREQGLYSVRGNHDQAVIAWRTWMEEHRRWLRGRKLGNDQWDDDNEEETLEGETWLDAAEPPQSATSEAGTEILRVPKGWVWKSQHFEIARRLPRGDYKWLLGLSLTLHVRKLHTYFVHAGMLPWERPTSDRPHSAVVSNDTTWDVSASPNLFSPIATAENGARQLSDQSDDASILLVEENRDPFTLLNVRGLRKGRKVTKSGKKGTPWFEVWNEAMEFCAERRRREERSIEVVAKIGGSLDGSGGDRDGRELEADEEGLRLAAEDATRVGDGDDTVSPEAACRPLGIVYGHWAAKGLTVNPYSIGLDSGCVYGRSMSALVLGDDALASAVDDEGVDGIAKDRDGWQRRHAKFQGQHGVVFSMPCSKP